MTLHILSRTQALRSPRDEVFAFFASAANLEEITPPWLRFEVLTPDVRMRAGARIDYRLSLHGVPLRWVTRIAVWDPPRRFVDVQLRGPYRFWHHTHEFTDAGDTTLIADTVRYALPLGTFGTLAQRVFVDRDLGAIFDFRHERVAAHFTK